MTGVYHRPVSKRPASSRLSIRERFTRLHRSHYRKSRCIPDLKTDDNDLESDLSCCHQRYGCTARGRSGLSITARLASSSTLISSSEGPDCRFKSRGTLDAPIALPGYVRAVCRRQLFNKSIAMPDCEAPFSSRGYSTRSGLGVDRVYASTLFDRKKIRFQIRTFSIAGTAVGIDRR